MAWMETVMLVQLRGISSPSPTSLKRNCRASNDAEFLRESVVWKFVREKAQIWRLQNTLSPLGETVTTSKVSIRVKLSCRRFTTTANGEWCGCGVFADGGRDVSASKMRRCLTFKGTTEGRLAYENHDGTAHLLYRVSSDANARSS